MSIAAYIRNGVRPGPKPTYFDIQPTMMIGSNETAAQIPKIPLRQKDVFILPLMNSASMTSHMRQVLGTKPYPFSIKTGIDPGPRSGKVCSQGYARHQKKGLAYMIDGKDHVSAGPLLVQADSSYAGMNNRIPLPP